MKNFRIVPVAIAAGMLLFVSCDKENFKWITTDFEDLQLEDESYWNGSDGSGGFTSGEAFFPNSYNAEWLYWEGFSYSNITDNTTAGFGNQFSAYPGGGANGSPNYAVVYTDDTIEFDLARREVKLWVANSTYAALSMRDGDQFAKKFGGETGNDPDWYLLTISAIGANLNLIGTADVYLADFRPDDHTQDYISNAWNLIDLSEFGEISKLSFTISSSDVGEWGINTPTYFCIDNIVGKVDK